MSQTRNQYWQVLRTYWRRPLILLLTIAFGVFLVGVSFKQSGSGRGTEIAARPKAVGRIELVVSESTPLQARRNMRSETLSELRQRVDALQIRSLHLGSLDSQDPMPDLSPFLNLCYLKVGGSHLTVSDIDQLCQLPKLEALVVTSSGLPAGALERLGQKVSQLEIPAITLEDHPEGIPRMTKVKLLALNLAGASPDLLDHVMQVPHLEQLSLIHGGHRSRSENQSWNFINLSQEQIAVLRSHPTLKEVYADWSSQDFLMRREGTSVEQAFLPVRALPFYYSKHNVISGCAVLMIVLLGIVSLQLWAHFALPAASVVPNYLAPHRRVAAGVFIVGIVLACLVLLSLGFGLLAALSVVLLYPALGCLMFLVQLSPRHSLRILILPIILIFSLFSSGVHLLLTAMPGETIWYLHGHMPWEAAVVIGCEVLMISLMFRFVPQISNKANETFASAPAFSPWDKEHMTRMQMQKMNRPTNWILDLGRKELHYCQRSTLGMANLWRQGNAFRPLMLFMFVVLMVLFGLVIHTVQNFATGKPLFADDYSWVIAFLPSVCGIGVMIPAAIWWQRCQSLENESLRPITRRALVRQLYVSLALDHWIVLVGAVGLIVFSIVAPADGNFISVELLLPIGAAGLLWVLGTNATVLAIKRSWVVVGMMVGLYALAGFGFGLVVAWERPGNTGVTSDGPFLLTFVLLEICAAIALNLLMYRAALKREWG